MGDGESTGWGRDTVSGGSGVYSSYPDEAKTHRAICAGHMAALVNRAANALEEEGISLGVFKHNTYFTTSSGQPLEGPFFLRIESVYGVRNYFRLNRDAVQGHALRGLAVYLRNVLREEEIIQEEYPGADEFFARDNYIINDSYELSKSFSFTDIQLHKLDALALARLCTLLESKPDAAQRFAERVREGVRDYAEAQIEKHLLKDNAERCLATILSAVNPEAGDAIFEIRVRDREAGKNVSLWCSAEELQQQEFYRLGYMEKALLQRGMAPEATERFRKIFGLPSRNEYIQALEDGVAILEAWAETRKEQSGYYALMEERALVEEERVAYLQAAAECTGNRQAIRDSAGWRKIFPQAWWPGRVQDRWQANEADITRAQAAAKALGEESQLLLNRIGDMRNDLEYGPEVLADYIRKLINHDGLADPRAYPLASVPLAQWKGLQGSYKVRDLAGALEAIVEQGGEVDEAIRETARRVAFLSHEYLGQLPSVPYFLNSGRVAAEPFASKRKNDEKPKNRLVDDEEFVTLESLMENDIPPRIRVDDEGEIEGGRLR